MSNKIEIPITKVAISHVVGKGGATIKQLQQETGAEITIQDLVVVITANEAEAAKAAAVKVRAIIEKQANPDYEGPEGSRLRKEADALAEKRTTLMNQGTAFFESDNKDEGHKVMAEAKAVGEAMKLKNEEAAAAIIAFNNKGKGLDYLDLHGLRTEEALAATEARLDALAALPQGQQTTLELIPGAGHHSAPGKVALKPAVEKLLKERGLTFEAASAGSLTVQVTGTGAAAVASSPTPAPAAAVPAKTDAGSKEDTKQVEAAETAPVVAGEEGQSDAQPEQKKKTTCACAIM